MNPQSFIASILLVSSFSVSATEIVRINDGASARCENRADVARYATSPIYRPTSIVRLNAQEAMISLQFLKCSNERSSFNFSADSEPTSRTVVLERGPMREQDMTVTIERKNMRVVVYTESGKVLDSAPLKQVSGDTFSAVIKLEEDNVLFNVHSQMKITNDDTGAVIDSGREILGSYRLKL